MKLGYYKLTRAKEKATDWIWIIDHSVQIGCEKCLLIVGIRIAHIPKDRPLTLTDLEPIELIPVKKSTGKVVYEQLKKAVEKTGIPREILSDHGSDLNLGITLFIKDYPQTCSIYDIKHKTASELKKVFEQDAQWSAFKKQCKKTKAQLQQTSLAFLAPPNQRQKSRYMNIDILITWGVKLLAFMEGEKGESVSSLEHDKIQEKLSWILSFRDRIHEWSEMMLPVHLVEHYIRNKGYSHRTLEELNHQFNYHPLGEQANTIKNKLLSFVATESKKVKANELLIGSSEVIESLFGKQKALEGEHAKNGFTGLILSISSFVSKTTIDVVEQAMVSVKIKDIKKWISIKLGETLQARKRNAFSTFTKKALIWNQ